MKKLTWTIVIIFLLLSAPVAAQFYRYFDEDGYLRFTDDLNKVPPEQRANIRKYRGAGSGSATFSREDGAEIEESQRAGTQPSENQVFGSVATAPEATVSLKDLRTQIEKMKEQVEAEYLALVNAKDSLAKQRDIKMTQEDLGAYNRSVDEFNQRAINYERMSSALSEMVGEFNAIVLEENVKLSNR